MATRVQNVQNGQKNDFFRLPPLCSVELKPKQGKSCRPVVFRAQPLPRDLNRRPEAPGPDLQLGELAYRAGPTGTLPHSKKLQRGGSRKTIFGGEKYSCTKKIRKSPFSVLAS